MHAIQVSHLGGPEVLEWTELDTPEPGPGQVLVQLGAIGVNYIDTYHREGIYPLDLPFVPGWEGAGTVAAVGSDVEGFKPGDRVASTNLTGAYAEYALAPAERMLHLPDDAAIDVAAAALLQGLTAHYLCTDTYPIEAGETCLIHAGAGGVGRLLIQMAKKRGATVIATAGSAGKAELAASAGADHAIDYTEDDFVVSVERFAGPRPLAAVYDGVGEATFEKGLSLIAPRGTMVLFGQSSGVVPPFDLGRLATNGSLYVTRPTLGNYIATREELERRATDLFDWIGNGSLEVRIPHRWPLREAAAAHIDLEARRTTGKLLLEP